MPLKGIEYYGFLHNFDARLEDCNFVPTHISTRSISSIRKVTQQNLIYPLLFKLLSQQNNSPKYRNYKSLNVLLKQIAFSFVVFSVHNVMKTKKRLQPTHGLTLSSETVQFMQQISPINCALIVYRINMHVCE